MNVSLHLSKLTFASADTLSLAPDSIVLFVGPNSSGKSQSLSQHNKAVASNLLDQNFSAEAPNEKWAADISYIWTAQGWLYLAVMLDLYSRRVIGWAVGARMTSDLPLRALNRAIGLRQPGAGVIHHSDSEYLRAGSLGVT